MLKSLKNANKKTRRIQNIIAYNKRDQQIDSTKTTLTLDSDKQKQTFRKTWKTKTKNYHR